MKCALSVRKLATVKQKAEVHTERERERETFLREENHSFCLFQVLISLSKSEDCERKSSLTAYL